MIREQSQRVPRGASRSGGAAGVCVGLALALACAGTPETWVVRRAQPPSPDERYCAWFGDARDGILYFGESAFWSTSRVGGSAVATLEHEGPARIGRFDLATEQLLEPIDVTEQGDRSGVWDVLVHPNGRIYFTTLFGAAGWVAADGSARQRLPQLGAGLNELAPGPRSSLLATRYFGDRSRGGAGSVVRISRDGRLQREFPLQSPEGYVVAAKTPAWDPAREQIWVTADLLPTSAPPAADVDNADRKIRHASYLLDARGRELAFIEEPEIQFVAFAEDGTGYRAELDRGELWLRVVPPDDGAAPLDAGYRVLLDPHFPAELDFAQEVRPRPDGGAVVTRWSGRVHVIDALGRGGSLTLPSLEKGGLYYTAVEGDGRVCATYCADVAVVCEDAP